MSFVVSTDFNLALSTKSITAARDLTPTTCPALSIFTPVIKVLPVLASVVAVAATAGPSLLSSYL